MKRDDVRPFVVPSAGTVTASRWQRLSDGVPEPLPDHLPDWDQNTRLSLRSTIEVDLAAVVAETGLPLSMLVWAVGWQVRESGLVGRPRLYPAGEASFDMELEIPPDETGNTLILTRRLVLGRSTGASDQPLLARLAGSVLWSDETILRLSGTGAAFPVEVVDFAKISYLSRHARNSWYLELPTSVDQPVLGGLLLMVNAADTVLADAVKALQPNEVQQALIQLMQEQIVELMVRWALSRWEELPEADDGSIGAVARILAERVLPEPDSWTGDDADPVELHVAIIEGARRVGLGRTLG